MWKMALFKEASDPQMLFLPEIGPVKVRVFLNIKQPPSSIMWQSYYLLNYFWHNFCKATSVINLIGNAFVSAILNVFLFDQYIDRYNYKDILPILS